MQHQTSFLKTLCLTTAFVGSTFLGVAHAQDRYQMQTLDNGIIRLDTQTGEVSQCLFEGQKLVCSSAQEDKSVTAQEIARLRAENEELRKQLANRSSDLPSEEEIEETVSMIEKFISAFLKATKNLEEDIEGIGSDTN